MESTCCSPSFIIDILVEHSKHVSFLQSADILSRQQMKLISKFTTGKGPIEKGQDTKENTNLCTLPSIMDLVVAAIEKNIILQHNQFLFFGKRKGENLILDQLSVWDFGVPDQLWLCSIME
ncbi:unnamed protein product [Lactuca virosa]|uniref:Ubiquitin-like domain-containing protein n=1 Tax=Lactuca virosa TaxID=75947 RepID=A0AAU9LC11_9ASTR|nr:unnamed protein product [Lactuca virosa]